MIFPTFRAGQPFTSVSAREMNNLSRAAALCYNDLQRRSKDRSKPHTPAIVRTCAMWKRVNEEIDTQVWCRRVGYAKEPPDINGNGPYMWLGDPFPAYPDFGKRVRDYKDFAPPGNEPSTPNMAMTFLRVQREAHGWVAWFPVAGGSPIFHAVIRDTLDPFGEVIKVQRLTMDESGNDVLVVDDEGEPVLTDALVPPKMLARDFTSMVLPIQFGIESPANVIKVYLVEGKEYAEQTTKFTLAAVDEGYAVTDCVLQQMGGG